MESLVAETVARRLDPAQLRRVARRMLDRVDPTAADRHQAALLAKSEAAAAHHQWMTLRDQGNGTWEGRFLISDLHAHLLQALLQHLSSPRRWHKNSDGEVVEDPTVPQRSYAERLGDAFAELIEHLPTDGWSNHGRVGATVMVHLDHRHLVDGLAAAGLDTGGEISASEARRLACNAGILPAVFDGPSHVLDLGREQRLHTAAQRAVLSKRHHQCAAEGCRRPFAWCEIHHLVSWAKGGRTDLDNAVPLCGWHHHAAHHPAYTVRVLPSGKVRFRRIAAGGIPRRYDHTTRPKTTLTTPPAPLGRIPAPRAPSRC